MKNSEPANLKTIKTEKIMPFSTGSQAADWKARNCNHCKKRYRHDQLKYHCRWEKEIDVSWVTDGEISPHCVMAIGLTDETRKYLTWDCPSLVNPGDSPRTQRRRTVPGQYNLFQGETNGE